MAPPAKPAVLLGEPLSVTMVTMLAAFAIVVWRVKAVGSAQGTESTFEFGFGMATVGLVVSAAFTAVVLVLATLSSKARASSWRQWVKTALWIYTGAIVFLTVIFLNAGSYSWF